MMEVKLQLDEYLDKFEIFNVLQALLQSYYALHPVQLSTGYENMLKEQFPTLYNLISVLESNLTYKEIWMVANRVYAFKGVVDSLKILCDYLSFDAEIVPTTEEGHYDINLQKVTTNSVGLFLMYFNQLIDELLMYGNYKVKIDQLFITYTSEFESTIISEYNKYYTEVVTPVISE